MDEIASQLGVSKKTIYQSFDDKNELVDAVVVEMLNDNMQLLPGQQAESPRRH